MKPDKFQWDDTVSTPFPCATCATCAHRMRPVLPVTCAAFPAGVTEPILRGEHQHREPFPGDRGLQWILHPRYLPPEEQMPR